MRGKHLADLLVDRRQQLRLVTFVQPEARGPASPTFQQFSSFDR